MATRGTRKGDDALLHTAQWRAHRAHWMRPENRRPCGVCTGVIDYDGPRYLPGTRTVNERYLHVGHIVGRHEARALGWSNEQINALTNTRPECAHCSGSTGATYGNQLRSVNMQAIPVTQRPITASRW